MPIIHVRFILDTSAVINGFKIEREDEIIIPLTVSEELKSGESRNRMEVLLALGATTETPGAESMKETREKAEKLGEITRLSETDITVIALGLERNGCVVSDDYSIENLCSYMGLDFLPAHTKGIRNVFRYAYRCTGCGRYHREYHDACPVCGSPLKARRTYDSKVKEIR